MKLQRIGVVSFVLVSRTQIQKISALICQNMPALTVSYFITVYVCNLVTILVTNKPGNWAKALTERYCMQNNVLHFYVQESGEVLYGVNGVQKGLFLTGLDTSRPLWIVVDIYGNTLAVEFLGL